MVWRPGVDYPEWVPTAREGTYDNWTPEEKAAYLKEELDRVAGPYSCVGAANEIAGMLPENQEPLIPPSKNNAEWSPGYADIAAARDVLVSLKKARLKHRDMDSAHEGYAVLLEEVDELWDEVKRQEVDLIQMRKEALQVAAMAIRFVVDVIDSKKEL